VWVASESEVKESPEFGDVVTQVGKSLEARPVTQCAVSLELLIQ
jgi:hypothetical protein